MLEKLLPFNLRACIDVENNQQISWSLFTIVHAGRRIWRREFILFPSVTEGHASREICMLAWHP